MALKAVKTKVQVGFGKKEDKTEKTMARLQLAQLVSLDELAENINDKTAIPVPTAKMVLEYLPEAIAQFVRLGHGVDVGFGILKPSISTVLVVASCTMAGTKPPIFWKSIFVILFTVSLSSS